MQSTFTSWRYIKEKKLVFCQIKTKQKMRQHQSRSFGIDPFGMWTFVQTLLTIHPVVVEVFQFGTKWWTNQQTSCRPLSHTARIHHVYTLMVCLVWATVGHEHDLMYDVRQPWSDGILSWTSFQNSIEHDPTANSVKSSCFCTLC